MSKTPQHTVLISPLNWGLGHATRIIPLIRQLSDDGKKLIVAAEKKQLILLKTEFPDLDFIEMKCPEITYSTSGNQFFKIMFQVPKFILNIWREHHFLNKIINDKQIDLIISDNRYGMFSKQIPSLFITHQISPKLPSGLSFLEKLTARLHRLFINRFDACLIPDFENEINLSGNLSHQKKMPENSHFIGILSRFSVPQKTPEQIYEIAAVISGPETQRSVFEAVITKELSKIKLKSILILGKPNADIYNHSQNIDIRSHVSASEMQEIILSSKYIVTRAGYSSIMDLVNLQKTAIIIPTPGQSEQEYLAKYLSDKKLFISIKQHNFNLEKSIKQLENLNADFSKFNTQNSTVFLKLVNKFMKS